MSSHKEDKTISDEVLALYDRLVATNPDLKRKGTSVPHTSLNGHMFTFLSDTGVLAIRLPKKKRDSFLKKYNATLMESYGVRMQEYVAVPEHLLKNTEELQKYLEISFRYIQSMKPKLAMGRKYEPATPDVGIVNKTLFQHLHGKV